MPDNTTIEVSLRKRAENKCELCGDVNALAAHDVAPRGESADECILLCTACAQRVAEASLDPNHWYCLQETAWSQTPAIQVTSWRLLNRLPEEVWARELLEQLYLEDDVLAWAREGRDAGLDDDVAPTLDGNGVRLHDGDSVTLIKDLDVKGAGFTAKRGTLVKSIQLTDNPEHVEGRVNKTSIVLKTCFLKRA